MKSQKFLRFVIIAALAASCGLAGCNSKEQAKADQSKLEEAKNSADAAEKKLYETKQERMRLEGEKGKKQDDKADDK